MRSRFSEKLISLKIPSLEKSSDNLPGKKKKNPLPVMDYNPSMATGCRALR